MFLISYQALIYESKPHSEVKKQPPIKTGLSFIHKAEVFPVQP